MPAMPVVWSPRCRDHVPGAELWVGVNTPGTELPERVDRIRATLRSAGHPLLPAQAHGDEAVLAVHDAALVSHLRNVYAEWVAAGFPEDPGQDRVVPYFFPTAAMLGPLPARIAAAVHARAGQYAYDTMTLVGPGTWSAARAAVDCALTAVDVVRRGGAAAYALCRPPGHHVTASAYGGSCYLNNAAVAAQALRDGGFDRVAIIDIDAHHGNGSAAMFYQRADVFYGSVHVDPGAGWFPHVVGYGDETGSGPGAGCTRNLPLRPGSGDVEWLDAVRRLATAVAGFGASALVVSLGVDAALEDPESPLRVSRDGFFAAGAQLGALALPTVAVQEGGYHLASLGPLVAACLDGLSTTARGAGG